MPSNKIIVRKIYYDSLREILESSIYKEYNCDDFCHIFKSYYIFKLIGTKFSQISYSSSDFDDIIQIMNNIKIFPYSVGIPILKITKSEVFPLLPLGGIMSKYCKNKISLPNPVVMKLIYGKSIKVSDKINFKRGLLISNQKFIAFIRTKSLNRGTLIIPELDIGWYLRKGG